MQRIVCAANRLEDVVLLGVRHWDTHMRQMALRLGYTCNENWEQGFVDNQGAFLTREEAMDVAIEQNQIYRDIGYWSDELYSEHLY